MKIEMLENLVSHGCRLQYDSPRICLKECILTSLLSVDGLTTVETSQGGDKPPDSRPGTRRGFNVDMIPKLWKQFSGGGNLPELLSTSREFSIDMIPKKVWAGR